LVLTISQKPDVSALLFSSLSSKCYHITFLPSITRSTEI